jgi:hypothetical protein
MVWIVATGRQTRFVSKNLTNLENACRRATIALFLSKTGLILPREPGAPGEPVFSKQHRKRSSDGCPITATRAFKESQLAAHGIPRGRHTDDELRTIFRKTISMHMNARHYQQAGSEAARNWHKKGMHFHNFASCFHLCGNSGNRLFWRFYYFEVNLYRL